MFGALFRLLLGQAGIRWLGDGYIQQHSVLSSKESVQSAAAIVSRMHQQEHCVLCSTKRQRLSKKGAARMCVSAGALGRLWSARSAPEVRICGRPRTSVHAHAYASALTRERAKEYK